MEDIQEIERITVDDYNQISKQFWEGTRDHDVSQNRQALLRNIQGQAPFRILDLGCGPGRDLHAFRQLGHQPVGLDAAPDFCRMAREHSGCQVLQQHFSNLQLEASSFDGVFANASLFHVPLKQLDQVLKRLFNCLKPNGVLFSSNPRGNNLEGWNGNRYGNWHDLDQWRRFTTEAGFQEVEHYYRPPGKPRHQQPWLASVWRKPN